MSALLDVTPLTYLRQGDVDSSPPSGTDRDRVRLGMSQVLIGLSLLLTWSMLYLLVLSGLEQGHTQSQLYKELRAQLAEGTAPIGAPITPGAPVGLISIPAIDLADSVVVEGSRPAQLQQGPGHVLGSVLPGQQGVAVIAGRSLSFGAPFARIGELPAGVLITVTTGQGVFTYEVLGVRRAGDPVPPPVLAGEGRLTLVSAARGGLQASQTVYVDADLTGEAVAPGVVSAPDPDAGRCWSSPWSASASRGRAGRARGPGSP